VPGFLEAIIALCTKHGAVSIFDEVMTGCRLSSGGYQVRAGLTPDMTCLGKIVGGGMPLAVYGGKRAIMEKVAPLGPVYQAGTLSGNPVAVAAALTTLAKLDDALYTHLENLGAQLESGLNAALAAAGVEGCVQRVGSMITLFFAKGPVKNWSDASSSNTKRFAVFHQEMLARGEYWPPSQYEAAFLSNAHTTELVSRTVKHAEEALRVVAQSA
jgi:glutamate-1-semialdehyde 2,1-aminomutase